MKAQENPSDPAEVVKPHLKSMLNGPFSVPRSHEWDSVDDHQPNKAFVYTFFCKPIVNSLHFKQNKIFFRIMLQLIFGINLVYIALLMEYKNFCLKRIL